jgi:hypothetical protein
MANLTDDVLKWTLDINGNPAMKELSELEKSTYDLERTNKDLRVELQKMEAAGKKNTEEYKRLQNQMKGNKATIDQNKSQMGKLRKEVGLNALTAKQLRQEYRRLKTQMDNTTPGTAEWKRLDKELNSVKNRLGQVNVASLKTNQVMGALKGMLPVAGVAALVAGFKQLLGNVIGVRQEFEKYEAILTNSLGSQKAARKELNMLKQFAAETPFALNELTGAFVKLTNYGLKPTRDDLVKYGDLASSVGKGFDQFTEAIADAVTFEFERLKEFGIKAKKQGDQITFTFKEQATVVDANAQSIKGYLSGLGELQGVAGSMAAISETLGGRISNFDDAWDSLMDAIGGRSSKILTSVIGAALDLVEGLTKIIQNFDRYARILKIATAGVGSYFLAIKLAASWDRIHAGYIAAKTIVQGIASTATSVLTGKVKLATVAQKAWNVAQKSNPIGLIVGLLAAAGTALYIYSKRLSAAEKLQRELNNVNITATKSIVEQKMEVERLMKVAKSYNSTEDERIAAIKKIIEISPEYLGNVSLENIRTEDATTAKEKYIAALL